MFLQETRALRHSAVITAPLREEWRSHQSTYASAWLADMQARRLVDNRVEPASRDLRDQLTQAAPSHGERELMLKDAHLIEAALATDHTIAALDDRARDHFARTSATVPLLRSVAWVNPNREEESPLIWLRRGARAERGRLLGNFTGGVS